MRPGNRDALELRVERAAEAVLAEQKYVSALDVLSGMGLLPPSNVEQWRQGRIAFLEQAIQGGPQKISRSMACFGIGRSKKVSQTRGGEVDLRVTAAGDPEIEKVWRIHFLAPDLTEVQRRKLEERLNRPPERVVFQICAIPYAPNAARNSGRATY